VIESYENKSKEELITELITTKEQLAQYKKLVHGSKSERFVPEVNPQQLLLDLDIPSDKLEDSSTKVNVSYTRRQAKQNKVVETGGRMALPADLPRVEIIIEPTEDVTGCKQIGEVITE
jgi:hypothetical protein